MIDGINSKSAQAIVVIPARGGSKRFPRKNIAPLLGHPLLAYSIVAAREAETVDAVYVSTEDEEIAKVATSYHADVPFLRNMELAGDAVTADAAVSDMIKKIVSNQTKIIDIVVLIQPTSPFVTSEHIDKAVNLLRNKQELDSVTTMCELDHRHHPFNLAFLKGENSWEFIFNEERKVAQNRQSKPKSFKFGNLFAARVDTMIKEGRFGINKGFVQIDPVYSWDIDYEWELNLAEVMLAKQIVSLPHINKL